MFKRMFASPPSTKVQITKPVNPILTEAWPPGSRRVYWIGVILWVVIMQVPAIISDIFLRRYWWLWHLFAFLSGFTIGQYMMMRILAVAIQERKNQV